MARAALRCAALLCVVACASGFGFGTADTLPAPDAASVVGTASAGDATPAVAVATAAAGDAALLAVSAGDATPLAVADDASSAPFSWKATLAEFAAELKKGGGAPLAAAACDQHYYGSGWGGHTLCRPSTHALNKSCFYIKCVRTMRPLRTRRMARAWPADAQRRTGVLSCRTPAALASPTTSRLTQSL
jgi:hypothetical protein